MQIAVESGLKKFHKFAHRIIVKHLALLVNRILILPITRSARFDAIALAEIDTDLLV